MNSDPRVGGDDTLLQRLLAIANHPRALDRDACPPLHELDRMALAANDPDPNLLDTLEQASQLFHHIDHCELCRGDFALLRESYAVDSAPLRDETAARREQRRHDGVRRMMKRLFDLSDSLQVWTEEDLLLYRPLLEHVIRLTRVSLHSITLMRRGDQSVKFETPEPSMLLDRILAGALGTMRAGDSYSSTTTLEFWRSILPKPTVPRSSAFFTQMVRALNLGVGIRRMLPIDCGDWTLLEAIARFRDTNDATAIPDDYAFLRPHIDLAKKYDNYQFRILLVQDDRREQVPPHCGFGCWTKREMQITFIPQYRTRRDVDECDPSRVLCGLRVVRAEAEDLRTRFEVAWHNAIDVRAIFIGSRGFEWLGQVPMDDINQGLEELTISACERLYPAVAEQWQRLGYEGLHPLHDRMAGTG